MKYKIFAILIFLFPTIIFSEEPNKKLHLMGLYPTVKVVLEKCECKICQYQNSAKSIGTGVVVRSEKILGPIYKDKYINVAITAAHNIKHYDLPFKVLVGKYKDWSEMDGFEEYNCLVYEKDVILDLAIILFISEKKLHSAKLNVDKKIYIGDRVTHFGYGLGDDIRFDSGEITAVKTVSPKELYGKGRMNAHTVAGDSGGPVFDEDFNLIGIIHAIRRHNNQLLTKQSYFVRINDIKFWNEIINNDIGFVYKETDKLPNANLFALWLLENTPFGAKK